MLILEVLPHEEFHALVESLLAEVGRELHQLLKQFVESGVETLAESRIAQDIDHPNGTLARNCAQKQGNGCPFTPSHDILGMLAEKGLGLQTLLDHRSKIGHVIHIPKFQIICFCLDKSYV